MPGRRGPRSPENRGGHRPKGLSLHCSRSVLGPSLWLGLYNSSDGDSDNSDSD